MVGRVRRSAFARGDAAPARADRSTSRRALLAPLVLALLALAAGLLGWLGFRRALVLPPRTTPEGAYVQLAAAVSEGDPVAVFPCLDEAARDALESIRVRRKAAREQVLETYPEPERARLAADWQREALAPDAPSLWLAIARDRHLLDRLRRDLSGIASVERVGQDAAILETVRGTRYELRRGRDGAWGFALFTPDLVAAEERARRDAELVREAAKDYRRGR